MINDIIFEVLKKILNKDLSSLKLFQNLKEFNTLELKIPILVVINKY